MKRKILFTFFSIIFLANLFSIENPIFVDSGQNLGQSTSKNIALADFDEDGDTDAWVVNYDGNADVIWINDGVGFFTQGQKIQDQDDSLGIDVGDLDNDGDIDAFVVFNNGKPNKVYLNQGKDNNGNWLGFIDSGLNLGNSMSINVALGDLDCNGYLDAFVVNWQGQPDKVYLNQGKDNNGNWLGFIDSGQNLGYTWSRDIGLRDLDGDTDLDAFVVNGEGPEDLDGDTDYDAFVANVNGPNKVWFNNGDGYFIDSGQNLGNSISISVDLGDLDGDKDYDAFVTNYGLHEVWLNDGNGTFTIVQELGNNEPHSHCVVSLGDLDGDDVNDAFVVRNNFPNKVYFNQIDKKINALIEINPNTLAKKSKGEWVTCYIYLPDEYNVNDIDISTVELEYDSQKISAARGDIQGNVLMVKFSRQALSDILGDITGNVELKVNGKVASTSFEGTDMIRVI